MIRTSSRPKIQCPSCGGTEARTSRLRILDVIYLGILKMPVRCRICMERYHVDYRMALQQLHWQQSRSFLVMEAHKMRAKAETEGAGLSAVTREAL